MVDEVSLVSGSFIEAYVERWAGTVGMTVSEQATRYLMRYVGKGVLQTRITEFSSRGMYHEHHVWHTGVMNDSGGVTSQTRGADVSDEPEAEPEPRSGTT